MTNLFQTEKKACKKTSHLVYYLVQELLFE